MKRVTWLALASASVAAISTNVAAQPAGATSSQDTTLAEIVVTARRRAESLQTVPQTVNAVTGTTLDKLNIRRFEDVQAIVPGLTLTGGQSGFSNSATIRGAPYSSETGAPPTVAFYLNDATIGSTFLFQSMFDVGQIEVLRGPQGTLRGQSSPSGSITVTTRRPSLSDFGGYGNLTVTDQHARNLQAAVNAPIIKDMLGLRISGLIDDTQLDGVGSVNSPIHPSGKTWAVRPSIRFEPNDDLSVDLMYQHLQNKMTSFQQVASFSLFEPTAAQGPLIRPKDRVGITDDFGTADQRQDIYTANAEYRFAGQKLNYVGAYSASKLRRRSVQDPANIFSGVDLQQFVLGRTRQTTNEIRLSSDDRIFGIFDYTVGAYALDSKSANDISSVTAITAFGRLASVVQTPISQFGKQHERSVFGSATLHLGDATEVTGGLRKLWYRDSLNFLISGSPLLNDKKDKAEATLYNVSVSHRFTDDFMLYANTGSAFRPGPFIIGVFRPLTPTLERHLDLANEKSKSYEAGFKSTFFDKRVLVNAAIFHQDFNNFIQRGPNVYYVALNQVGPSVSGFNFGNSVDAKINGVDIDASWQVMQGLNLTGAFSYAKSKIKDGLIACTDINRDGVPDNLVQAPTLAQLQAATGPEALSECVSSDPLQFTPKWNLTLQGEYARPLTDQMEGYLRGLFTYRPKTSGDPSNAYDTVDGFGLLNLYAGVRSRDGAWELALFAKNVFNTEKVLTVSSGVIGTGVQALQPPTFRTTAAATLNSTYAAVTMTPPREIGINLRYAFGTR